MMLNLVVEMVAVSFLMVMSFPAAATSWFLQYLYGYHPIGKKYKMLMENLEKKWYDFEKNQWKHWSYSLLKPFGLCVYCQNVWVSTIFGIILINTLGISILYLIPYLSLSYISLEIQKKWV